MVNRKTHFIALLVALAALLLAACAGTATTDAPSAEEPQDITLLLAFIPDVQFAPFYVALENGYFADAGFNVSIEHRSESDIARAAAQNDSGPLTVGVISGEQHLLARAQGLDIVYVYQWYQDYPIAVAAKDAQNISDIADLQGLSVGVPMLEGASYLGLRAILEAGGLTEEDIDLQATGFTQVETLVTDQVDAVVVYTANEPTQLTERGVPVTVLPVADYVDLVSNGLIVNGDRTESDAAALEAFIAAFDEAVRFTIDNPDEAFTISTEYVEGLDDPDVAPIARQVLDASITLWQGEQLGLSEADSWQNTQDILIAVGLLEEPLNLDAAYTNEFLPE